MPRAVAVGLPEPALQISASPRGYQSHFGHAGERIWPEPNCYLDLWIETLHALGLDPVPALACALSRRPRRPPHPRKPRRALAPSSPTLSLVDESEGVLLHLPPQMEYDDFAHPSLAAAIMLGLRQVIGGSPEHLAVATIRDALRAADRRALLIHDTVPGGTVTLPSSPTTPSCGRYLPPPDRSSGTACVGTKTGSRAIGACCRSRHRTRWTRSPAPPRSNSSTTSSMSSRMRHRLDAWTAGITEQAPPPTPTSDESFLEREFYAAFIERLKLIGATVIEKPGTYGPSATITLQGAKPRKWSLRPQVSLGFVKPDFMLQTADPAIPQIAIFADGRAFHAVPGYNRVADDATKRAALRSAGYLVWTFGQDDVQRFKTGDTSEPAWFDQKAASVVASQFLVQPGLVWLLTKDPVRQLLEFMVDPDLDSWEKFSRWMPYLFVRGDNRVHADAESAAAAAIAALDGTTPFTTTGTDVCWTFTDGGVAVTAGVHTKADPPRAVLAVDDRDDRLESLDGKAWKEWLRLSNWLGISGRPRHHPHAAGVCPRYGW